MDAIVNNPESPAPLLKLLRKVYQKCFAENASLKERFAIKGLNEVGKVIKGSKVLIMGLTYKENAGYERITGEGDGEGVEGVWC